MYQKQTDMKTRDRSYFKTLSLFLKQKASLQIQLFYNDFDHRGQKGSKCEILYYIIDSFNGQHFCNSHLVEKDDAHKVDSLDFKIILIQTAHCCIYTYLSLFNTIVKGGSLIKAKTINKVVPFPTGHHD